MLIYLNEGDCQDYLVKITEGRLNGWFFIFLMVNNKGFTEKKYQLLQKNKNQILNLAIEN